MNVVFTCGGTGGHIYPAIAVAKLLQERHPDCEILFIGAEDGMENRIVPREGFRLETLKISNLPAQLHAEGHRAQRDDAAAHVRLAAQGQGHHPRVRPGCHRRHGRLRELPGAEDGWQTPHPDDGA